MCFPTIKSESPVKALSIKDMADFYAECDRVDREERELRAGLPDVVGDDGDEVA